jgi:hypothetical protein
MGSISVLDVYYITVVFALWPKVMWPRSRAEPADSLVAERLGYRPVAGWIDFNGCTTMPHRATNAVFPQVIYQLLAPYSLPSPAWNKESYGWP